MTTYVNKPTVYAIRTPRLLVRCWEPADAPALNVALHASWEHLAPWMPWARGERPALDNTVALLRRWRADFDLDRDFVYGIFSRDGTQVLGSTGLHTRAGATMREIGYWVHVDAIGQGYATETAAALTQVAFEIAAIRRVEIRCLTDNVRSAAVPRKLGYTHEATLRQVLYAAEDDYRDGMVWAMLAGEYPGTPASQLEIEAFDVLGRPIT